MERNKDIAHDGYAADGHAQETSAATKPGKSFVCITYILFVIAMLAGLCLPLYGKSGSLNEKMLLVYLPGMLNSVYAEFGNKLLITKDLAFFIEAPAFDYITALFGLLYTLLCVIGIIGLIPVLRVKNDNPSKIKRAFAFEAEIILFACLFTLALTNFYSFYKYADGSVPFPTSMVLAMCAGIVILIVQSIVSKGYLGVFKTIGVVLAIIAAMALFDITYLISGLKTPLGNLSKAIAGTGEAFTDFMYNTNGHPNTPYALYNIYWLIADSDGFFDAMKVTDMTTSYSEFNYIIVAVAIITVINVVIDLVSLCTGRKIKADGSFNKETASSIFGIVRYAINLVVVIGFIVTVLGVGKYFPGIYAYLIAVVCLLQIVVIIIKMVVAASKAKAYDAAHPQYDEDEQEEDEQQTLPGFEDVAQPEAENDEEPEPAPEEESEESGEQMQIEDIETAEETPEEEQTEPEEPQPEEEQAEPEEPQPEEEPEQPEPAPAPVYEQPEPQPAAPQPVEPRPQRFQEDKFLSTLSPDLQDEFEAVFLNKSKGEISGVPEYNVGGDNSDFFTDVFVHVNRTRNVCSDELLENIYKQIGKN